MIPNLCEGGQTRLRVGSDREKYSIKARKYVYVCPIKARYARCPVCNRRLRTQVRECNDPGCWHEMIPPHKARTYKAKTKRKGMK